MILLEIFYVFFIKNNTKNQLEEFTKKNLRDQAIVAEDYISKNSIDNLKKISEKLENRITVISNEGKVIYDSMREGKEENLDSHRYREELKKSFGGEDGFSVRYSRTLEKDLMYYSLPIKDNYIIRVAADYTYVKSKIVKSAILTIIFFCVLNLLLIILYKIFIISYYRNKIYAMKKAINNDEEVSKIYLEEEKILKEFWNIIKKWQKKNIENVKKVEEETEKLKEIISSIDMCIVVINEAGEIILENNESIKNIMQQNITKTLYYERIKFIEVIKFINKLKIEKDNIREEIYFSELKKHYFVYGKFLLKRNLYLIALKDITKDKELDEIQKRFITNISHELKTPLTNIKGYVVALSDEKEEFLKRKFLDIVERNIAKIENMISDFLNISKAESTKILNIYNVNISEIVEDVQKSLSGIIEEKKAQIIFQLNIYDKDNYIKIDKEKVLVILKNLIENSIIYCKKQPKVIVKIEEIEKEYLLKVEDNGIGIPKDELKNIFERFYKVDKSRTENFSGTGLGLSIVDEIVNNYNGNINVESIEEVGTKFIISIPKE